MSAPTTVAAPVEDRQDEGRIGPRSWIPVAASIATIAWGGNEFTPLLGMYREAGGLSPVVVDALLGAYVLGIIPALILGGQLSDRYGRRPLLLPAAPLSLTGSLLLSLGASSPLLIGAGRVLCGLALGLAMAVGTAWVTELSRASGTGEAGPRRASLSLTLGFLLGAGVAAALVQWGPWPTRTTYMLHMLLTVSAAIWLLGVPETRERAAEHGRLTLPHVPRGSRRRFLLVIAPLAPWVFGAAGTAYAVMPAILGGGSLPIAYAGLMTVVTLGSGAVVQTLARRLDTARGAVGSLLGLGILAAALVVAALAARAGSVAAGFLAAAMLGAGYGLSLVAGLDELTRIAGPEHLAGLTALYYSLAYAGFFIPMLLTAASQAVPYPLLLAGGAGIAVLVLLVVAASARAPRAVPAA